MEENHSKRAIIHIDKDTLVPLGLVITVITALIAATWFSATLNSKVDNQEIRISRIESAINDLTGIKIDIGKINTKLDALSSIFDNYNIVVK